MFGIWTDLEGILLPPHREGFDRLLVIPENLGVQELFETYRALFPAEKCSDLSLREIVPSRRSGIDGPYAVRVREREGADEELRNIPARVFQDGRMECITLEERFVYELMYFVETGRHLDQRYITLTAGSRYRNGSVPTVGWLGGRLWIYWYFVDV